MLKTTKNETDVEDLCTKPMPKPKLTPRQQEGLSDIKGFGFWAIIYIILGTVIWTLAAPASLPVWFVTAVTALFKFAIVAFFPVVITLLIIGVIYGAYKYLKEDVTDDQA